MRTARYVGGPLDGRTVEKTAGRWSVYRDDDGQQISTARGDKEFYSNPRAGMPLTRYYHHQQNARPGALPLGDLYIHASVWHDWRDSNQ